MFKNIVVGTDGSSTADRALDAAAELAREHGATLHVVSAFRTTSRLTPAGGGGGAPAAGGEDFTRREQATQVVAAAEHRLAGVSTQTHALAGDPADVLTQAAEQLGADLIVVGSKGMRGARRILGSVPNSVAHQAPCAVLIVKTD